MFNWLNLTVCKRAKRLIRRFETKENLAEIYFHPQFTVLIMICLQLRLANFLLPAWWNASNKSCKYKYNLEQR